MESTYVRTDIYCANIICKDNIRELREKQKIDNNKNNDIIKICYFLSVCFLEWNSVVVHQVNGIETVLISYTQ